LDPVIDSSFCPPCAANGRFGTFFLISESWFRHAVSTLDLRRTIDERLATPRSHKLSVSIGRTHACLGEYASGTRRGFFATQHFCHISVFPDKTTIEVAET
jgi:hypothetical protein